MHIFFFSKEGPNIKPALSEGVQESIYPYQQELNITEGSEFLDDAIRTKDQPLGETATREDA